MADNTQTGLNSPQVAIVVVPFPAQGHLNQLLHLSRLLSAYNLPVHYVGTTTNIRQARIRLHGWDPLSTSSNIHFHEFETPPFLSLPPDPTALLAYPSHLQPAFDASIHLREPVGALLHNMSLDARRIVVIHDALMATVVQDVATIPCVESYTFECTSAFCLFWFLVEIMGKPCPIHDEIAKEVPSIEGCLTPEFFDFAKKQEEHRHFNSGKLYNTCKSIEGKYIDLLTKEEISGKTMHWAIGPLNPVVVNQNQNKKRHSITCGVPIATWPMHSDQPNNAVLITKVLRIGVTVKDWKRRKELVTALMVERSVRRLLVDREGEDMRKRAAELGGAVKRAVAEGGVCRMELDSFVARITR